MSARDPLQPFPGGFPLASRGLVLKSLDLTLPRGWARLHTDSGSSAESGCGPLGVGINCNRPRLYCILLFLKKCPTYFVPKSTG